MLTDGLAGHRRPGTRARRRRPAVLEGPAHIGFATVADGGDVVARGRDRVPRRPDDWVGVTDVWVSPDRRRERLGIVVLHALLGWAAERGATTAYLQVRADNPPALALYERLGFERHHAYRYLRPGRRRAGTGTAAGSATGGVASTPGATSTALRDRHPRRPGRRDWRRTGPIAPVSTWPRSGPGTSRG